MLPLSLRPRLVVPLVWPTQSCRFFSVLSSPFRSTVWSRRPVCGGFSPRPSCGFVHRLFSVEVVVEHHPLPKSDNRPFLFVDSDQEFEKVIDAVNKATIIGLDTEFIVMPHHSPKLEVLQISTDTTIAVIDAIYCTEKNQDVPMTRLLTALFAEGKEIIVHSGKADMEIFLALTLRLGVTPRVPSKLFDTQVAAAFLGYGAMIGYANLMETLFGSTVDKGDTLSDWSRRPLSANQIEYAMNDVKYLLTMREILIQNLKKIGRYEWCMEEMKNCSVEEIYMPMSPRDAWKSIRQAKKLHAGSRELVVLQHICAWRELAAKKLNMKDGILLKNEVCYAIAMMQPSKVSDLENIQSVKQMVLRKYGHNMLLAVKKAMEKPLSEAPLFVLNHRDAGRMHEGLFNLLNARVQSTADDMKISQFELCPRQQTTDLSSVSREALDIVSRLEDSAFCPVPIVSNFFGVQYELLPAKLNTFPLSVIRPPQDSDTDSDVDAGDLIENIDASLLRIIQELGLPYQLDDIVSVVPSCPPSLPEHWRPLTLREEIEMLRKLKVLSGWRRKVIGDDLLKIALGTDKLTWDDKMGMARSALDVNMFSSKLLSDEENEIIKAWVKQVAEGADTSGDDSGRENMSPIDMSHFLKSAARGDDASARLGSMINVVRVLESELVLAASSLKEES